MSVPFLPEGSVAVVTGAAGGIGAALATALVDAGAHAVVVVDLDETGLAHTASHDPRLHPHRLDCTEAVATAELVDEVEARHGPIDLWCGNAGLVAGRGLGDDRAWNRSWSLHVDAHLIAARLLLPRMIDRGSGHLMLTASAAGLLTQPDNAPYAVTKHATVALAEWLAITHHGSGIGFSCLCPQAVRTPMTDAHPESVAGAGAVLEPEQVAAAALDGMARGRFLLLSHPEVADYERRRTDDHDRWIAGMARHQRRTSAPTPSP
jgi:NAD(P)-dependent dehydrogenase (short-subunit alcohol dehydrogenase family)